MTTQNTNVQIQIITTPENLQGIMDDITERAFNKAWGKFKGILEPATQPLFSRKEAAQYLNISLGTLNTLIKTKQLNCSYIGNSPKFKLADLEEFVNTRK